MVGRRFGHCAVHLGARAIPQSSTHDLYDADQTEEFGSLTTPSVGSDYAGRPWRIEERAQ